MIICLHERTTSQGMAHCHQREQHNGDHIAYVEDADLYLWIASWYGKSITLTPIGARP